MNLSDFSGRCGPGILGILPGLCFFILGFLPSSFKLVLPTSQSVSLPTLYYWIVCLFKKTPSWCILHNKETLLEYLVEIFPLKGNHRRPVRLKVWPVPLPGVSCVPTSPCWVPESSCSSCKSPRWPSCYNIVVKTANSSSTPCLIFLDAVYMSHLTECGHWNVSESPRCHFQAWKSLTCVSNPEHGFLSLAWSTPLKLHAEDGRTWLPESLLERKPAIDKENPLRILRKQEINFFLICSTIQLGAYMFHHFTYFN